MGVNFETFGLGIDLCVISQMYSCFQLPNPAQLRIGQIRKICKILVIFYKCPNSIFFRNEASNWILLFLTLVLFLTLITLVP